MGYAVFATVGANSVRPRTSVFPFLLDSAAQFVLPYIVIILVHFASWSRYQRTAIAESLASDHVKFAVLKGLSRQNIVRSYVVRPALVPIITIVALDLPVLLSGQ